MAGLLTSAGHVWDERVEAGVRNRGQLTNALFAR
jgi:hypothetical protein